MRTVHRYSPMAPPQHVQFAENTASGQNIGTAVAATDADNDTLTYILGGTDAASFSIVSTSGQLQTSAALDYETKSSYTVTVSVSDGNGGSDSITVTINITDLTESTITPVSDRTWAVRAAIVAAVEGVDSADDVTEEHLAAITSLEIEGSGSPYFWLEVGDFDGLTALTSLSIDSYHWRNVDADTAPLPGGIFDKLTSLTSLTIRGSIHPPSGGLASLPSGIFDKLTSLRSLSIAYHYALTSLPNNIFDKLNSLTSLSLINISVTTFQSDIFDKLTSLTILTLGGSNANVSERTLPSGIFGKLTNLTELNMRYSRLSSLPSGIFDQNTKLEILILGHNQLSSLPDDIFDNLTVLWSLGLNDNQLSSLQSGIFENLTTALRGVSLSNNQFNSLPNGIFKGFGNSVRGLSLRGNPVDPLPLIVSLEKVADGQFKAVAPTYAPYNVSLPLSITNGSISGGATSITINAGSNESNTLIVTRNEGTTAAVTVDIGTLPTIPRGHDGYRFVKSDDLPLTVIGAVGGAPATVSMPQLPKETALMPNFPNPFNPETWIPYQLAKPAKVTLTIYNMRGVVMRTIALEHKAAGVYTSRSRAIHWDGRNAFGEPVASGVYFYTLTAGDFTATRKMLIRK